MRFASFLSVTTAWSVDLTFDERVRAEMALEAVRQTHRGAALDISSSRPVLEVRVRRQLVESHLLATVWNTPLTEAMLDGELRHMIEDSRLPERLRGYCAALDNAPLLIREVLVRPALVRRLTRSFFRNDRTIHAGARSSAEQIREALAQGRLDPAQDHPLRVVVEQADAIDDLAETAEAFHTDAAFTGLNGYTQIARYVVRKLDWDDWLYALTVPTAGRRRRFDSGGRHVTSLPNAVIHYLVGAENGCVVGQGPVGEHADGTPRSARSCEVD